MKNGIARKGVSVYLFMFMCYFSWYVYTVVITLNSLEIDIVATHLCGHVSTVPDYAKILVHMGSDVNGFTNSLISMSF